MANHPRPVTRHAVTSGRLAARGALRGVLGARGESPAAFARFHHGLLALAVLGTVLVPLAPEAHEVRPAYLQLTELSAGRFEVLWKQPILPGSEPGFALRLPLEPKFPPHCLAGNPALPDVTASALVERWVIACGERGLAGAAVEIGGLPRTLTDVLLRVRFLDGASADHLLRPEAPRVVLSRAPPRGAAVPAYLRLGIEHLLFGFDHILFIVGLMFLVRRPLQLVQVVTAFTAAHSITLALSTLGVLTLSQRPVEALIALSILFLAVELVRGANGRPTPMARSPWVIAFGFGLLHGFGFAGALSEIGLPEQARAMALLLFNAGVEIGQLAIVVLLLALVRVVRVGRLQVPAVLAQTPIYVMGVVSAYWFVERVFSMV